MKHPLPPTEMQSKLAKIGNVSLAGLGPRAAAARLQIAFAEDLLLITPTRPTTDVQAELAEQLRINDLSPYCEIAALQIKAELIHRNESAMLKYEFHPGMVVRFVGGPHVYDLAHTFGAVYEISTVKPDGRVYFRNTSGACAYGSQLRPVRTRRQAA